MVACALIRFHKDLQKVVYKSGDNGPNGASLAVQELVNTCLTVIFPLGTAEAGRHHFVLQVRSANSICQLRRLEVPANALI
jgi:hypothetical protein